MLVLRGRVAVHPAFCLRDGICRYPIAIGRRASYGHRRRYRLRYRFSRIHAHEDISMSESLSSTVKTNGAITEDVSQSDHHTEGYISEGVMELDEAVQKELKENGKQRYYES